MYIINVGKLSKRQLVFYAIRLIDHKDCSEHLTKNKQDRLEHTLLLSQHEKTHLF